MAQEHTASCAGASATNPSSERASPRSTPEPTAAQPPPAKKARFFKRAEEVMQFESVTRGRFEKSKPTIVEGQDLDVPTSLRKNVRVK